MRALVIDDAAKETARRVVEFAIKPENWYRVDGGSGLNEGIVIPGSDLRYGCKLNTFRCVFSITKSAQGTWRHLSISVPSEHYPNPFAVYTIAELFGFKGWNGITEDLPANWQVAVNPQEHCIVMICPYKP